MNEDNHLARAGSTALTPVSPEEASLLWAPAERKVRQPAQLHGITDLAQMGFSRISDRPQVVTGEDTDWLIFPAEHDPIYQQGQLAAPPEVRARLRELLHAGVSFDALSIAHQVPPGALAKVKKSEDLQRLLEPQTPKSLAVLSNAIGSLIDGAWRVEEIVAHFLTKTVDPVIFGAVVATPPAKVGDADLYFLIARWTY